MNTTLDQYSSENTLKVNGQCTVSASKVPKGPEQINKTGLDQSQFVQKDGSTKNQWFQSDYAQAL